MDYLCKTAIEFRGQPKMFKPEHLALIKGAGSNANQSWQAMEELAAQLEETGRVRAARGDSYNS